jgi:signal transduction histidine kinase
MATETPVVRHCFLLMRGYAEGSPVLETVKKAIVSAGFRIQRPVDASSEPMRSSNMAEAIARADCVVADLTKPSPALYFELGLVQALDKPSFILVGDEGPVTLPDGLSPENLLFYDPSSAGLKQLSTTIGRALRDLRRFPHRPRFLLGSRARNLFVVDWERLSREDIENLCLELLTQLGFRRVAWEKEALEIDVIAELPKKDPDGFEYRELWLVSLGRGAPPEALLDMLYRDPDFFLNRMLHSSNKLALLLEQLQYGDVPVTFLVVSLSSIPIQADLFPSESRIRRKPPNAGNARVRVWDRNYLTGLVYQFPQIGFKYFSDESRAKSKYRKTPEELYSENTGLVTKLTVTLSALDDEKNRRVRAERDAVWKDISFSAAHKMGNPIFAIETNLDPLELRMENGRTADAVKVVRNIRKSIEKAKAIVAQFKSLTVAQKIRPTPTQLLALLEEACSVATAEDVQCSIDCPPELQVQGDRERLGECFDELVNNAIHWFNRSERKLDIVVSLPSPAALPDQLDSTNEYVLIHVRDNGAGVPLENKTRIFDAFFSTYTHGTGLGLALVRRIVEGHGGAVFERGISGEGADFEIYLPLAGQKQMSVITEDTREGTKKTKTMN